MIDLDKLEALRAKAERSFGMELHEAYKNELFIAAPALIAEIKQLRAIEAAAKDVSIGVATKRCSTYYSVLVTRCCWDQLRAALAVE